MESGRTDRDLLLRISRGDTAALGVVLDLYWAQLVDYVTKMGVDRDTAEDVTQQAFVRLWERRVGLKLDGSLRGLLYKIARNLCIDMCRRRSARERAAKRALDEQRRIPLPIDFLLRGELRATLSRAVNALPKRRREVFILVRQHGLSHREVSEALDLAPQTVANHLSMALLDLRESLAPQMLRESEPFHRAETQSSCRA